LTSAEVAALRDLMLAAFAHDEHGGFTDDDWRHALGGTHFVAEIDGAIAAHASVVPRTLYVDGQPVRTGYVEAVATRPEQQRRGYGSALRREVNVLIAAEYEMGALGTGSQGFYERLGWRVWQGPSHVRTVAGDIATPDEDGYIMVLLLRTTPTVLIDAPITCEWRPGDVW
jgi:aminoglycoside 2'-N-acetyltransferase I